MLIEQAQNRFCESLLKYFKDTTGTITNDSHTSLLPLSLETLKSCQLGP